jgi:hypothetical protein
MPIYIVEVNCPAGHKCGMQLLDDPQPWAQVAAEVKGRAERLTQLVNEAKGLSFAQACPDCEAPAAEWVYEVSQLDVATLQDATLWITKFTGGQRVLWL